LKPNYNYFFKSIIKNYCLNKYIAYFDGSEEPTEHKYSSPTDKLKD